MEQFIKNILDGKKSKRSLIDQLYIKPKKDVDGDNPTIPIIDPNYSQYIDLLYLPNDGGKKYALVLVDQGSRYCGAEPLEDRSAEDVIKALKEIYKGNKFIKKPKIIISDAGKEFMGNFDFLLSKMGIEHHKTVKAGRHRSILAERKNQTIGKIIGKILTQVQATSGNVSSKWVSYLPMIINAINEKVEEKNLHPISQDKSVPITYNPDHKIDLLDEGTKVRVALDNPIDLDGKQLHGKFRSGDIRWDPKIRTIKYIYMKPNEPIMYFLDGTGAHGVDLVGYTRNQLQKVSKQERNVANEEPLFENEENRYEVQKLLNRGEDENGNYLYLVKFKKVRKPVWTPRNSLVEDLGTSYMKKMDKYFDTLPQEQEN